MVKKSSTHLFGYKILKGIQMKRCQQKIVERVLRVWIAKILNETMLLDEKVCLPLNNTLKKN